MSVQLTWPSVVELEVVIKLCLVFRLRQWAALDLKGTL